MSRSDPQPQPDLGESAALPITLLVAPTTGRLRVLPPRRFRGGREWVEKGQPVARVEHGGSAEDILAPMHGRMGGILGRDGQPVSVGQPVAWMEGGEERQA